MAIIVFEFTSYFPYLEPPPSSLRRLDSIEYTIEYTIPIDYSYYLITANNLILRSQTNISIGRCLLDFKLNIFSVGRCLLDLKPNIFSVQGLSYFSLANFDINTKIHRHYINFIISFLSYLLVVDFDCINYDLNRKKLPIKLAFDNYLSIYGGKCNHAYI